MGDQSHWDSIYATKRPDEVSWYQPHLELSLRLINYAAPQRDAAIIDVGGGEATLVDDLLTQGYRKVAVLDVSETALQVASNRLGARADWVQWLQGDVTTFDFESYAYDVWHDRAVFHFLTEAGHRTAYVRQVIRAVKPGGHVIVATFGPDAPTRCSGLDVLRYDAAALHSQFGAGFELIQHETELHQTPAGSVQQFVYCHWKVTG